MRTSVRLSRNQRAARLACGYSGRYRDRHQRLACATPSVLRLRDEAKQIFPNDAALRAVCQRYGIRRLSLFGSTLQGTDQPDSDGDLLVEFQPGASPSLLTMAEIELALSPLLGGRKVDLRTAGDLSRYFRDQVVRTAEPQYEA